MVRLGFPIPIPLMVHNLGVGSILLIIRFARGGLVSGTFSEAQGVIGCGNTETMGKMGPDKKPIARPPRAPATNELEQQHELKTTGVLLILVVTGGREIAQGGDVVAVPPSPPQQVLANEAYRLVVRWRRRMRLWSAWTTGKWVFALPRERIFIRAQQRSGKRQTVDGGLSRRFGRGCRPPLDAPWQAGRAGRGAQLRVAGGPADHGRANRVP